MNSNGPENMVDSSKRRSLKSLGVMFAVPLAPTLAIQSTSNAIAADAENETNNPVGNDELNITLLLDDEPMMRVTNASNSLTILRRINPGVVHAGAKSYDLNHAFTSSSYAIGAGLSRLIPIAEVSGHLAEVTTPASSSRRPLRLATISSSNKDGRTLNSSRAFFA